jgi:hypothetical protein
MKAQKGTQILLYTFFTSALDEVEIQRHVPATLPLECPGTLCTRGRVGPRAGLDESELSRPYGD